MKYNNLLKLFASIIICELAGVIGSVFTTSEIGKWYNHINKPSFNPPNWIFGPVWTTLFVLMGISLYLVWAKKFQPSHKVNSGEVQVWNKWSQKFLSGSWRQANIILVFAVQLLLNILWSVIFFGMHSLGVAFAELLMFWFAILFTVVNFYRVSKTAGWLLVPYLLWVTFAGILNLTIFLIN